MTAPALAQLTTVQKRVLLCRVRVVEAQRAYDHCPSTERLSELEEAWEMLDEWLDRLPR